jgi:2-amino-4-hydroxy-6-hydroxymethyldihydropteridine diphosphokinase
MSRAVISFGANLGDRLAALRSVVAGLRPSIVAVSSVYETRPWGLPDQPDFLNAVLVADDAGTGPSDRLVRAHALEAAAGRERRERWGPRTLDVDIIDVDGLVSPDPALTLPHPRASERAFVLVPWAEIEPCPRLAALIAALPATEREAVALRPELSLDADLQ